MNKIQVYVVLVILGFVYSVYLFSKIGMVSFLVLGGVIFGLALWELTTPKNKEETQEAKTSGTFGRADFASESDTDFFKLKTGQGIPLGYFYDVKNHCAGNPLHYDGESHGITFAAPRTGKGTTAIIPTLLEYSASTLVIDPKGQNAAVTAGYRKRQGHDVFILNPYKLHPEYFEAQSLPVTHKFNPLALLNSEDESFVDDISRLAAAIIQHDGGQKYFTDSARDWLASLMMWIIINPHENPTLGRVRQLMRRSGEDRDNLVADMMKAGFEPLANKCARFLESAKSIDDVIQTALTQTAFLDSPPIAECLSGSDFDFKDMKKHGMTVYLVLPLKRMQDQAQWFRLLITAALDALLATPKKHGEKSVLFILDEFAQLGHLDAIEGTMAMAAGCGVQLWPILQDVPQLQDLYAKRWKSFLAAAGFIQIFGVNDDETAKHFSDRAGMKTVQTKNINVNEISQKQADDGFTGINIGYGETGVPLLRPQDFIGMPKWKGYVFLQGLDRPIETVRINYFDDENYRDWAGPIYGADPFHSDRPGPVPLDYPAHWPMPTHWPLDTVTFEVERADALKVSCTSCGEVVGWWKWAAKDVCPGCASEVAPNVICYEPPLKKGGPWAG